MGMMTMGEHRDPQFPAVIPAEVKISDIDLDVEEFYYQGERLTEARANEIGDRLEKKAGQP
jgi:hypothetical protein